MKGKILSGMRPTGKLHIGHLSVLENWVRLQDDYRCNFMVADWHALTTGFEETAGIKDNIREMVLDWLSVGIDPNRSIVFVQSDVKEHAELHLLLSMITPIAWLERCPSYKDQLQQLGLQGKDINTYGFLGYPLLQAADILIYKGDTVPVGEDQIPHIEFCREVARRFNFMFNTDIFPEPQAKLSQVALLPGIDGRKMSKSYANDIAIAAPVEDIQGKVRLMITDPARIHKSDPGHPEVCTVHTYHSLYSPAELDDIRTECRGGKTGCVTCKKMLAGKLEDRLGPIRERREELAANPRLVEEILATGAAKARQEARATLDEVRQAMQI